MTNPYDSSSSGTFKLSAHTLRTRYVDPTTRDASEITSRFHPKAEVPQAMKHLETNFPHIYKFIVSKISDPQLVYDKIAFMLQVDTEGRKGFPSDAANALMVLSMHLATNHEVKFKSDTELKKLFRRDRW